jgi:transposase-like protein
MSRNSEGSEYSVLGFDQLILDGIEEKLRSILEAERDEVAGRRAYERIGQGKVGQDRNGYHKPRRLTCGCGTVTIRVPRLEKPYESMRFNDAYQILIFIRYRFQDRVSPRSCEEI